MPHNELPQGITLRGMHTSFCTRAEDEKRVIEGYFVVFDQPYYVADWLEETISRNAFDGCDVSDVRALIDHKTHLVLGRSTVKTLTFSIDDKGLFGTIETNAADGDAMNLYARVQRGDVDQASFGFTPKTVAWTDLPDGRCRREIQAIAKLWEVSVCTFPAYEQTHVGARSAADREIEREAIRREIEKCKRRFRHE